VAANLLAGMTYREMAEALGVSVGTVARDVGIVLGRWQREQVRDVEAYVGVECRRLDMALNAIWSKVQKGDLSAIDRLLSIQGRRARYLGLDGPIEVKWTDDELLAAYKELVDSLTPESASGGRDPEAGPAHTSVGPEDGE